MQQMPEEGRLFVAVDKTYRDIMRNTALDTHVLKVREFNKILDGFKMGVQFMLKILKLKFYCTISDEKKLWTHKFKKFREKLKQLCK